MRSFDWTKSIESWKDVDCEVQLEILRHTVHCQLGDGFGPHVEYVQSFLKFIINKLEGVGQEISDELYEVYGSYIMRSSSSGLTNKTYFLPRQAGVVYMEESKLA